MLGAAWHLTAVERVARFSQNRLPLADSSLFKASVVGVLPVLLAGALVLFGRGFGVRCAQSAARLLAPAALAFALPGLFTWQLGQQRPVAYLCLLALFGLALERLLRVSVGELATLAATRRWSERYAARFGGVRG